ncbi:MAG: transglutaminase-like domain-containing protein [Athalassotoga sp.]
MEFLSVLLPEEIRREESAGNFEIAKKIIEERLSKKLPLLLRKRLEYELERIKRVIKNYPYDEKAARSVFEKSIKDGSWDEFDLLLQNGMLDYILIDKKRFFEKRFLQNLTFKDESYAKRYENVRGNVREIVNKRILEILDGDVPRSYRVSAEISLTLKRDFDAEILRCWLPFPKAGYPIESVKIIECDHECRLSSNSENTTLYMEDKPKAGKRFTVRFEYNITEQISFVDPSKVLNSRISKYLKEVPPHIVFSPYVKNITSEIIGKEENPYFKAKKIYEWITENIKYSYMHAYSTYDTSLVDFALSNLKGDCGVQALTFITMCRSCGIPARWESGWFTNPIDASPHDWARFYVKPYGWLPVDPSFGGSRKGKLRDFYFGNLDAFRMIANEDFMVDFDPPKKFVRSDPYDNQEGEVETEKENIYYDDFETKLNVISFQKLN